MTGGAYSGPPKRLTRAEARARGLKTYSAVLRCNRDHEPLRRVFDGKCLGCLDAQREVVARAVERVRDAAVVRARRLVDREQAAAARERKRQDAREAARLAKEAEKEANRKARAKAARQARKAASEAGKGVGAAAPVVASTAPESVESWAVPVDDGEAPWF